MANEQLVSDNDNYQTALSHYSRGELEKAEILCNNLIETSSEDWKAWHLLGMIALNVNKNSTAIELINKSILIQPNEPYHYNSLAEAFRRLKSYDLAEAEVKKALAIKPDFPEALNTLGSIYLKQDRINEAENTLLRCVKLQPELAEPFMQLATVYQSRGQWNESITVINEALQIKPDDIQALFKLGYAVQKLGKDSDAITYFQRVIELNPELPGAHLNLAVSLHKLRNLNEALSHYQRAVTLQPDFPDALNCLAFLYADIGELEKAKDYYNKALELKPDFYEAWNNLGNVFKMQGELHEAVAHYKRAVNIKPDCHDANNNVLFSLHYVHDASQSEIEQVHKDWGSTMSDLYPVTKKSWQLDLSENKTLRVGFVSGDFYKHAVSFFLKDVIDALNKQKIEIYCYANNSRKDELTERLISSVNQWRDIYGLNDVEAAKLISDDKIDILVDLAGHTKGNRLLIFARKPAPIQATWLGYPNTTGLEAIDYRITDAIADPVGSTNWHSEELIRLEDGFLCFGTPIASPDIVDPPCLKNKTLTFGTFNNFSKLSPQVLELWIDILSQVENSFLLLKNDSFRSTSLREAWFKVFTSQGIAEERIKLVPRVDSYSDHLALYGEIDIALDVFPYNGTTTTCEAMWMGVPVITLRGDSHVSRVGASLLTRVGLEKFIAKSPRDYVEKSVALANDPDQLLEIRHQLRDRMRESALGDPHKFARQLEQAFQSMWMKWRSTQ